MSELGLGVNNQLTNLLILADALWQESDWSI